MDFAVGGRTARGGEMVLAVEVAASPGATPYTLAMTGGSDGVVAGALSHNVVRVGSAGAFDPDV